jgi:hypothetical protein
MQVGIELQTAVQVSRAFARGPEIVLEELAIAVGNSMEYLQREAQENTPTDLGTLRQAFIPDTYVSPQLDAVFGTLTNPLPYALPVEMGTKPHYPPITPLIGWVERKLDLFGAEAEAAARGIQRKIGRFGSPGYGMVRFAMIDGRSTIQDEFDQAARRIERRIAVEAAGDGGSAA